MSSARSEAARLFGTRIRDERQRLAITIEELADLSDVHSASVGRIERGTGNPNLETIIRLATALNIDPSVLVLGMSAEQLPGRWHRVTVADLKRARGESVV